jgi:hypothetical protein
MIESKNALNDFSYTVGDSVFRWAISRVDGGAVLVASVAIFDFSFNVSNTGLNTLQCYSYASISDSLSNKLQLDCCVLDKNSDYNLSGEYIVYSNFSNYDLITKSLCVSRICGENVVLKMDKGYTGLFISSEYRGQVEMILKTLQVMYKRL